MAIPKKPLDYGGKLKAGMRRSRSPVQYPVLLAPPLL
jgi:hypothetical protein